MRSLTPLRLHPLTPFSLTTPHPLTSVPHFSPHFKQGISQPVYLSVSQTPCYGLTGPTDLRTATVERLDM